MTRQLKALIAIVLFIVLLVGASALYRQLSRGDSVPMPSSSDTGSPQSSEPSSRETAPDFTVYDSGGNAVSLSSFAGKPVVLNFWASWCGPCRSELPDFQTVYDELGGDVAFVMVNLTDGSRETVETASSFVSDSGYTFSVYYDTNVDAAQVYGIYSIPTTYIIDAQGGIAGGASGAISEETLRGLIASVYTKS